MKPDHDPRESFKKQRGCGQKMKSDIFPDPVLTSLWKKRGHGVLLRGFDLFHLSDHLHWSCYPLLWTLVLHRVHHPLSEFTAPVSTVSSNRSSSREVSSDQSYFEKSCWERETSREAKERYARLLLGTLVCGNVFCSMCISTLSWVVSMSCM